MSPSPCGSWATRRRWQRTRRPRSSEGARPSSAAAGPRLSRDERPARRTPGLSRRRGVLRGAEGLVTDVASVPLAAQGAAVLLWVVGIGWGWSAPWLMWWVAVRGRLPVLPYIGE